MVVSQGYSEASELCLMPTKILVGENQAYFNEVYVNLQQLCLWWFRSVNQRSSNNQWVNSLADIFRGLFLSSVPDRISNLDITNTCAPTEIRTRGRLHTFHYHYRLAAGTHWYLWELPDLLITPYSDNVAINVHCSLLQRTINEFDPSIEMKTTRIIQKIMMKSFTIITLWLWVITVGSLINRII